MAGVSERLRIERSGPDGVVARVTLARPDVHNAFDASLDRRSRGDIRRVCP
jgi:enoyl-CoA hydratase/carnithine racemase